MPPVNSITRLRNFATRPLVRGVAKVLGGNIGGSALLMLTNIWIGVKLGEKDFGILNSVYLTTMVLLAGLADFGLSTAMVKYYRDFATLGRLDEAEAILRRSLWIRLWILAALAAFCIPFAGPIMRLWLGRPDLAGLFQVATLGIIGSMLWTFCQSAMQARQQFGLYAGLTFANHAVRLVLVALAILIGRLTMNSAMLILAVVPFLGIFGSFKLWPRRFWTAHMEPTALRRQYAAIFHFSKWIFISTAITTIIMRLDVLLLGWFQGRGILKADPHGHDPLGQYNFAVTLAQGIPLIAAAISTVLLPRLAATRRRAEIRRMVGIFLKFTPALVGMVVAIIVGAHLVVPLLKGGMYRPSIPVFDLLVIGSSISIVLNPISFFCLALERSSWLAWMNLAQLGLNLALSLVLIPIFGAVGAGISALLVRLFAVGFLMMLYPRLLKLAED